MHIFHLRQNMIWFEICTDLVSSKVLAVLVYYWFTILFMPARDLYVKGHNVVKLVQENYMSNVILSLHQRT